MFPGKSTGCGTRVESSTFLPLRGPQSVGQHVVETVTVLGRTIVLEIGVNQEGFNIPIGSAGAAWISAEATSILGLY
ncbi:hypothetical protein O9929_19525 [Vibrio lentus]|nr:hypothetical protein [Vibrio lentus]